MLMAMVVPADDADGNGGADADDNGADEGVDDLLGKGPSLSPAVIQWPSFSPNGDDGGADDDYDRDDVPEGDDDGGMGNMGRGDCEAEAG